MVGTYIKLIDSTGAARFFKITNYTSTVVLLENLNPALANTKRNCKWKEEVFSVKRGFAISDIFHDQRLIFGGTESAKQYLYVEDEGGSLILR